MEIFGVGPVELVLILVIVLVIFGPDQLPEIAKKLGGGVRELRRTLDSISSEVDDTVKPIKDLIDPTQLGQNHVDPAQAARTSPQPEAKLLVAEEAELATGDPEIPVEPETESDPESAAPEFDAAAAEPESVEPEIESDPGSVAPEFDAAAAEHKDLDRGLQMSETSHDDSSQP